jgi:hypothetical protein
MGHHYDVAGTYIPFSVLMFSIPCFLAAFMQLLLPFQDRSQTQPVLSNLAPDSVNSSTF